VITVNHTFDFRKKKRKTREKSIATKRKGNINYKEEKKKKRKLYRRVIGVGVLLLGVRKGKFRVV